MALSSGKTLLLRAKRAQFRGRVEEHGTIAMINNLRDVDKGDDPKEIQEKGFTAQTSTAATVVGSAAVIYGIRVVSPATGSTLGVIVQLLDAGRSNAIVGSILVESAEDAEVYFFSGNANRAPRTVGALTVRAVAAADGSSNPDAADRPDIIVYYGA